jgi:hypothetical protein
MRLLGLLLTVVGVLMLADQLLSPFARPLVDPGYSGYSVEPSRLVAPALFLALGLWLRRGRKPRKE